jgi:cytochrome c biogenesis protein CcdA
VDQLLIFLTAIALLDSLNPTAISLQIFLLSRPNPIPLTIAFIVGVFLAYWGGGLAIALGFSRILHVFLNRFPWDIFANAIHSIQFLLGVVLLVVAYRMKVTSYQTKTPNLKSSLTPLRTLGIGIIATVSDLPTALPYIAAIERIIQSQANLLQIIGLLVFYNLIFVLPLLILLGIYVRLKSQAAAFMEKMSRYFFQIAPKLLKIFLLGLGVFLIAESIRYWLGYTAFQGFGQLGGIHL